jgi:hypothetical protein
MAFLLAQSGEIPYDIGAAIVSHWLKLQFGIGEAAAVAADRTTWLNRPR